MPDRRRRLPRLALNLWMSLFVLFLLAPLAVSLVSAFAGSTPIATDGAKGFGPHGFSALLADRQLGIAVVHACVVGLAVVALSLPLGLAGALVLDRLAGRGSAVLFAALVAALPMPGLVVGFSTLVLWQTLGLPGGLLVTALAETGPAAACAMLLFLVRLDGFDPALLEAAVDLGAPPGLAMRRLLLPHLAPIVPAAAAVAFLQSFGGHDTALAALGGETTLSTAIAARLPTAAPEVDALGLVFAAATLLGAGAWAILRRRAAAPNPHVDLETRNHRRK